MKNYYSDLNDVYRLDKIKASEHRHYYLCVKILIAITIFMYTTCMFYVAIFFRYFH